MSVKSKVKILTCLMRGIGHFEEDAYVSLLAEIRGPGRVSLAAGAVLERNSRLYALGKDARITIGTGTTIYPYALLKANGGTIAIGNYCSVNDYSVFLGLGGITLGNNVHIASHAVIAAETHPYDKLESFEFSAQMQGKGITIGDCVWVGAHAVILDGVTLGTGAVIGAGAVVTGDIPPYSVAVGVPARVIKKWK